MTYRHLLMLPVAALLAGLAACNDNDNDRGSAPGSQPLERAGDQTEDAADRVGDKTEEAWDDTKDAGKDAWENTKEAGEKAGDKVEDATDRD